MKKRIVCIISLHLLALLAVTGCASTKSTIKEYDSAGKLTRETVTSESIVKTLTDSTRNKTVIAWENGWAAYLSVSTATQEDPTPTAKIFAGKTAKGVMSILPGATITGAAEVIAATREDLSVSTSGVSSSSPTAGK